MKKYRTIRYKQIKPCCDGIKHSIFKMYDNEPAIDTALYEENPVNITYCPYCGKKIETIMVSKKMSDEDLQWDFIALSYLDRMVKSLDEPFLFKKV